MTASDISVSANDPGVPHAGGHVSERERGRSGTFIGGWLVLVLVWIVCAPLHVCMPLTNDVVMYDMQAQNWLRGGVLYRDILEPNLPGIVWVHLLVRSLAGWSSEALRIADLIFYSGTIGLATWWLKREGLSAAVRVWSAVVLSLFYFSLWEWNHCQRDVWLLLPSLMALHLRLRQVELLQTGQANVSVVMGWSIAEAICWSCAVWIKPHVVIPAGVAWLVSAAMVRKFRPLLLDALTLVVVGLLLGAAGIYWLHVYGALPAFREMMFEWNPLYFQAGKRHWEWMRYVQAFFRSVPWLCLPPVALLVAIRNLVPASVLENNSGDQSDGASSARRATTLFSAFFIAWIAQVTLLQHQFDYVLTPTVLLATIVLVPAIMDVPAGTTRRIVWGMTIGFLVLAIICSPLRNFDRLSYWLQCWTDGSSPVVRDHVRLEISPRFQDLQKVAEFLRTQDVRDGELEIFHDRVILLYFEMQLRPPTRFVYGEQIYHFFFDPRRPEENRVPLLQSALEKSPQRFVLVDMSSAIDVTLAEALEPGKERPDGPPPVLLTTIKNLYPWSHPIVFRSGPYLVYKLTGPMGQMRWEPPRAYPSRRPGKNK